jgi:hypothetical protein
MQRPKPKKLGSGRLLRIALLTMLLTGCIHPRLDNAARLIERPDFPVAAEAAPEWVRDALKTINALEYDIERGR